MSLLNKISEQDKNDIAKIVVNEVKDLFTPQPTGNVDNNDNVTQVDKDVSIEAAHQAEAELIKQMVSPKYMIVRGKRTTQMINQTQQSLDAVRAYLNDRNQFGSKQTIR